MLKKEISYGIIPLRCQEGEWETLLVEHRKGHWFFPKGHPEADEDPHQTAARELKEETGLTVVEMFKAPPQKVHYVFPSGSDLIDKTVIYFIATVKGEIFIQDEDISDCQWFSLEEAHRFATFKESKKLCAALIHYLESNQLEI